MFARFVQLSATFAIGLLVATPAANALTFHIGGTLSSPSAYPYDGPVSISMDIATLNTLNTAGGYDIISVAGNVNGNPISLIPVAGTPNPPGGVTAPPGAFQFDNNIFGPPTNPVFTTWGVLLSYLGGQGNVWGNGPDSYEFLAWDGSKYFSGATGDLTVTQTPLPPALLLFGSALFGLTVLGRRRRQSAAV